MIAPLPRVTVVIVSYNTRHMLLDCLERLARFAPRLATQEIIVVDNASRDGTVEAVRTRFPSVQVIVNDRNAGFAAANNRAIRQSTGDYVLLLNSDAFVSAGTVGALVEFMEQHHDIGLAGCRLLNPDGSLQQSCYRYATLWRSVGDALLITNLLQSLPPIDDYRRFAHDRVRDVASLSGACLIARRAAIQQVGLLDERFFMYAEDGDWCRRFGQAGWRVTFTPTATVTHVGGGSQSGRSAGSLARAEEGNRRYLLKYYGPLGCMLWSQTALVGSVLRLMLHRLRHGVRRGQGGSGAERHVVRVQWHVHYWRNLLRARRTMKVGD